MSTGSHSNRLFTESGCLSIEALRQYSGSMLSEDEMKLVKDHLSECPLCKDAIDGVSSFDSPSYDLHAGTYAINRKLRQRFGYFPGRKRITERRPSLRVFLIPAAASIIIMFSIISYFHYFFPENNELAMADTEEVPEPIQEKEAVTIGGIMKDDKQQEPETSYDMPLESTEVIVEEPKVVEKEEHNIIEEEVALAALDEEISTAQPEAPGEAVTISDLEGMSGTGAEKEEVFAVSRAKSGKKARAEQNEMIQVIDLDPMFPGGQDSLNSFLEEHLIYPILPDASGDTIVVVQFTVSKKGKLKDVSIIQSAGNDYDNEVLRVIKIMPDWIPGVKDGENASMKHALSISLPLRP